MIAFDNISILKPTTEEVIVSEIAKFILHQFVLKMRLLIKILRITFALSFAYSLSLLQVKAQDKVLSFLSNQSDEILLIEIIQDSSTLISSNLDAINVIRAKIIKIIKSSRIPKDKDIVLIQHQSYTEKNSFPKSKILDTGTRYYAFLNTKRIPQNRDVSDKQYVFFLTDYHLGLQKFDRGLEIFFEQNFIDR